MHCAPLLVVEHAAQPEALEAEVLVLLAAAILATTPITMTTTMMAGQQVVVEGELLEVGVGAPAREALPEEDVELPAIVAATGMVS
jgi:hypothetical protein